MSPIITLRMDLHWGVSLVRARENESGIVNIGVTVQSGLGRKVCGCINALVLISPK